MFLKIRKEVDWKADVATIKNFISVFDTSPKIIHFSGHGDVIKKDSGD